MSFHSDLGNSQSSGGTASGGSNTTGYVGMARAGGCITAPERPVFESGTMITAPTLATDLTGKSWWVDPALKLLIPIP